MDTEWSVWAYCEDKSSNKHKSFNNRDVSFLLIFPDGSFWDHFHHSIYSSGNYISDFVDTDTRLLFAEQKIDQNGSDKPVYKLVDGYAFWPGLAIFPDSECCPIWPASEKWIILNFIYRTVQKT